MACVQCPVNFGGVASCGQVSYCEDGVCSLNDGLCTVSGELQGGLPAVVRSPIAKMLFVH